MTVVIRCVSSIGVTTIVEPLYICIQLHNITINIFDENAVIDNIFIPRKMSSDPPYPSNCMKPCIIILDKGNEHTNGKIIENNYDPLIYEIVSNDK